ncbi:MAG: CBS domain-containing protein [Thermococcus sp.]|uniref:CBS domain-containing protein n=1 Tax=Thermococcus sp. TaxID=35749 RepID=UPI000F26E5EC|nr:CBS domain-containing protein [Thermococcus sp.]RLF72868.1 MAG: CBS domain-containing protein [Thermococci archaeon]MCD6140004.1 CBS domain-containing protein [Thermococcus sp.]MCD6144649.1 CBS domain-containing protein [Thermococcus sp.]RLF83478.1 MAG: CBS domain-containing protein [Thermococci archaeon]RLF85322.1 MAG: CBS domain-containing protein [Thermococci archaeon]
MKVKNLMTPDPVVIELPATRNYALDLFKRYKVRSFPVVKRGTKEIVGIVSIKSVLLHPDEDQLAMLIKRDVPLVTPKDTLKKAVKLILKNKYRRVIVVDKENHVVGILTVGDIIRRYLSKSEKMKFIEIEPYYQRYVSVVWKGTPLKAALKALLLSNAMALPVIDDDGSLIGIIDETDLLKDSEIVRVMKTSELAVSSEEEWILESHPVLLFEKSELQLPKKPVQELMTTELKLATPHMSVYEVANIMTQEHIEQLPVIKGEGEIIGLIRDIDLVKAIVGAR